MKSSEHSFRVNAIDGAEMVFIPAGEFRMGEDGGPSDERPVHLVNLKGFWIYRTEVTIGQFAKFLSATGYRAGKKRSSYADPQKARLPVTDISWFAAQAYCRWAACRLPTEAEWEKSARGPNNHLYPYGDDFNASKANVFSSGLKEVASYPPNDYGLYDMSGNVWEWCADWYDPEYYSHSPRDNPTGAATGGERVLRGGSWTNLPEYCRATFRYRFFPRERSPVYGFRCVKDE